jgi:hypothetical protein
MSSGSAFVVRGGAMAPGTVDGPTFAFPFSARVWGCGDGSHKDDWAVSVSS